MEDERAAGGSNHGDPKITWAEVLFVASQRVISFGGAEKRRDVRRTVLWPPLLLLYLFPLSHWATPRLGIFPWYCLSTQLPVSQYLTRPKIDSGWVISGPLGHPESYLHIGGASYAIRGFSLSSFSDGTSSSTGFT